jgi:sulfatase maturation enzyme AslB (radical SAM superfamily)
MQWIAVSSNGSIGWARYQNLINLGVNDFSISLDACCAKDGDKMSGVSGAWNKVVNTIKQCSAQVYTTVGVVLTNDNVAHVNDIITFADSLGVSDIRIIPAAQDDDRLHNVHVDEALLAKFPILRYRINNLKMGKKVRGLEPTDTHKCGLVLDDMAVNCNLHYPCIIYMRESGKAIGAVGPNMREERKDWYQKHDTHLDPICSKNCLDVCVNFNNKRG